MVYRQNQWQDDRCPPWWHFQKSSHSLNCGTFDLNPILLKKEEKKRGGGGGPTKMAVLFKASYARKGNGLFSTVLFKDLWLCSLSVRDMTWYKLTSSILPGFSDTDPWSSDTAMNHDEEKEYYKIYTWLKKSNTSTKGNRVNSNIRL